MSPTIWTRYAARVDLEVLTARPWRAVEVQHVVSTRKLVDSDAEQHLLEDLIERAKPPVPPEPEFQGLHYLLTTPFRYPPLPYGSRFGSRGEQGLWYGAEELRTAFAEAAYYRLVFLEGTEARLDPVAVDLSAFRATVRSERAVDLTRHPFAAHEAEISSPVSYELSQVLGREVRAAGVETFRYRSARDVRGGAALGLFTPRAFASRRPSSPQTWYCVASRSVVELSRRDLLVDRGTYRFAREELEVDGVLPVPAA